MALYAFKAQADTELSFSKGDRLEVTLKHIFASVHAIMNHDWYICKYFQVLDRPASDPEWFKARNQMGQVAI